MKYITLYHYSNKDIQGKLKVSCFGDNYYTLNDTQASSVKRLFFYDKPKCEHLLQGCNYLYICKVKKADIYNITQDKKRLYQGNITELLRKVKRLKYRGVSYNIGYNVISLLYDIPIYKKEVLK